MSRCAALKRARVYCAERKYVVQTNMAGVTNAVSVSFALCGTERLQRQRYRLWDECGKATVLCHRLEDVVGNALPRLPSHVVCLACRNTIRSAAGQKERFEQTRKLDHVRLPYVLRAGRGFTLA